jgi:hypothetical protein
VPALLADVLMHLHRKAMDVWAQSSDVIMSSQAELLKLFLEEREQDRQLKLGHAAVTVNHPLRRIFVPGKWFDEPEPENVWLAFLGFFNK